MSTTIPLTINLPQELVNASEELIKAGKVKNFDEFIATAVQMNCLKIIFLEILCPMKIRFLV